MFARSLVRSTATPMARTMIARKASTQAGGGAEMGPIRPFFHDKPVPVDAYPLVAIVAIVCTGGISMLCKHIYEDRDHLRWIPKHGGVKFELPSSQ